MRRGKVRQAVLDGLTECMTALGDPIPAVFPGEPGDQFNLVGSAWISKVTNSWSVTALGPIPENQTETVVVHIQFSAYREDEIAAVAGAEAGARVDQMFQAFTSWLLAHQDLNGTCTHCLLGQGEDTPHAAADGWVALTEFTVTATCRPPFAD